ncbi:MAG: AzlD domain-containing protein [Nocardioidaceae bacterium]|nr:AzlD domain-containing protein [Nocardioidaceae bacterium]
MPDPSYVALAIGVAAAITISLRALPFAMRRLLAGSALLADLGRWMPLGALTILALYCLSRIDLGAPDHGAGPLAGVVVTVLVHRLRRNAVLSIVAGTAACLLLSNLLPW